MKIFSTSAIAKIDELTSLYEPISPVSLMERASLKLTEALVEHFPSYNSFVIFAGTGNNGGDGLVIARLLSQKGCSVRVIIVDSSHTQSFCFKKAMEALCEDNSVSISYISESKDIKLSPDTVIIDAIFGSGLNRPITGTAAYAVELINSYVPTSSFIFTTLII